MNRVQSFIARLFRIIPASEKRITIIEPHSFRENVIRTRSGITETVRNWSSSFRKQQSGMWRRRGSGPHMHPEASGRFTAALYRWSLTGIETLFLRISMVSNLTTRIWILCGGSVQKKQAQRCTGRSDQRRAGIRRRCLQDYG